MSDYASIIEKYPEHARLIGCIVCEFNSLESMLMQVFFHELKISFDVAFPMLYAIASERAKLHAMKTALEHAVKDPKRLAEVRDVFTEAEAILDIRNRYAHGVIAEQNGDPAILRLRYIMDPNRVAQKLTVKELEQAFARIKKLSNTVLWMLLPKL